MFLLQSWNKNGFRFLESHLYQDLLGFDVYSQQEVNDKIYEVAALTGLLPYLKAYPLFLPYGVQKLVELARALVSNPKLLLLDEPAAGLTSAEKENLKNLMKAIKAKGLTVLIVEHDMGVVMDISDVVTVMNFGQKIAEGKPQEISANSQVIEAYLGWTNAQDHRPYHRIWPSSSASRHKPGLQRLPHCYCIRS